MRKYDLIDKTITISYNYSNHSAPNSYIKYVIILNQTIIFHFGANWMLEINAKFGFNKNNITANKFEYTQKLFFLDNRGAEFYRKLKHNNKSC